jgi:hypothetical protein
MKVYISTFLKSVIFSLICISCSTKKNIIEYTKHSKFSVLAPKKMHLTDFLALYGQPDYKEIVLNDEGAIQTLYYEEKIKRNNITTAIKFSGDSLNSVAIEKSSTWSLQIDSLRKDIQQLKLIIRLK